MNTAPRLLSTWFDGQSPRAQACELCIDGNELVLTVDGSERRYPVRQVRWAERRSHGQRQSELPDGSLIQHADAGEWDAWRQASGQREGAVVGWMQSWRATLVAMGASVVFLGAAWTWGVPWLSQTLAQQVPRSLEARLGEQGLQQLDRLFLQPSALPAQQQQALRERFTSAVERAHPQGDAPPWQLSFHQSKALGANAFALPGGYIVITDDLVKLLADQPDAIVGVLAHELGHVHHRHAGGCGAGRRQRLPGHRARHPGHTGLFARCRARGRHLRRAAAPRERCFTIGDGRVFRAHPATGTAGG